MYLKFVVYFVHTRYTHIYYIYGAFWAGPVPIFVYIDITSWDVLLMLQEPPPEDYRCVRKYVLFSWNYPNPFFRAKHIFFAKQT